MRTLVIGLPLPHVSFDNYSFISAPAFSEYQRLIVDTASVSKAVEEVVAGEGDYRNFAGHPVHNGPSTAAAFSLQDLLQMRRRESEWFLARGGLLVCLAYPDLQHPNVAEVCGWRRYSWLPAPPGFRYEEHLLPGFGMPGAELTAPGHPFAPFIESLSPRLAYRVTIDESAPNFSDYGQVLARSHGAVPIAASLAVAAGHIILLPPLLNAESDRAAVAQTLFACVERWPQTNPPTSLPPHPDVPPTPPNAPSRSS